MIYSRPGSGSGLEDAKNDQEESRTTKKQELSSPIPGTSAPGEAKSRTIGNQTMQWPTRNRCVQVDVPVPEPTRAPVSAPVSAPVLTRTGKNLMHMTVSKESFARDPGQLFGGGDSDIIVLDVVKDTKDKAQQVGPSFFPKPKGYDTPTGLRPAPVPLGGGATYPWMRNQRQQQQQQPFAGNGPVVAIQGTGGRRTNHDRLTKEQLEALALRQIATIKPVPNHVLWPRVPAFPPPPPVSNVRAKKGPGRPRKKRRRTEAVPAGTSMLKRRLVASDGSPVLIKVVPQGGPSLLKKVEKPQEEVKLLKDVKVVLTRLSPAMIETLVGREDDYDGEEIEEIVTETDSSPPVMDVTAPEEREDIKDTSADKEQIRSAENVGEPASVASDHAYAESKTAKSLSKEEAQEEIVPEERIEESVRDEITGQQTEDMKEPDIAGN